MRRLIVWASPMLGIVLGFGGILVFRQQPRVEADTPSFPVPAVSVPASRPEATLRKHGSAQPENVVTQSRP
ncbi:MAG: hypothetical protein PHU85_08175 [Phycisphaerae bacterium]|nr:hypothetical protein [Phycisphaerae bacterium]